MSASLRDDPVTIPEEILPSEPSRTPTTPNEHQHRNLVLNLSTKEFP